MTGKAYQNRNSCMFLHMAGKIGADLMHIYLGPNVGLDACRHRQRRAPYLTMKICQLYYSEF